MLSRAINAGLPGDSIHRIYSAELSNHAEVIWRESLVNQRAKSDAMKY